MTQDQSPRPSSKCQEMHLFGGQCSGLIEAVAEAFAPEGSCSRVEVNTRKRENDERLWPRRGGLPQTLKLQDPEILSLVRFGDLLPDLKKQMEGNVVGDVALGIIQAAAQCFQESKVTVLLKTATKPEIQL